MGDSVRRQIGFREVADALRVRLQAGEYLPGRQLPSEAKLATAFGCSRDTVRDALAQLATEGLVIRRRGRRTTVRPEPRRTLLELAPNAVVTIRAMTMQETAAYQCGEGIPVFEIRVGNECTLHRGDEIALTTRGSAGAPSGEGAGDGDGGGQDRGGNG